MFGDQRYKGANYAGGARAPVHQHFAISRPFARERLGDSLEISKRTIPAVRRAAYLTVRVAAASTTAVHVRAVRAERLDKNEQQRWKRAPGRQLRHTSCVQPLELFIHGQVAYGG